MNTGRSGTLPILALLVGLAGCAGVRERPEVAARLDRIEQDRLARSVEALHAIGPRPIEDVAATERTVAWIRGELEGLGYTVVEEEVACYDVGGRMVAHVRRSDAGPDAEVTEIELPVGSGSYGERVLQSQVRQLRTACWDILTLAGTGGIEAPRVVPNLLAEIRGTELPDRVIELSAHYDTVPACSGADDNSSGVAVLLELARVLADARPRKTIRFCFFGAEEADLLGSAVHVENLQREGEPVVEALLNLDSVGLASSEPDSQDAPVRIPLVTWMPSTGDFLTVIGTWSTGWLGNVFEDTADAYVPELPLYSANRIGGWFEDGRRSDHAHYWDAGIPAVFLTDTGEFRSDTYHRPSDVPDTLDFRFMRRVAVAAGATVLELDRR